jgi:ferredoxin
MLEAVAVPCNRVRILHALSLSGSTSRDASTSTTALKLTGLPQELSLRYQVLVSTSSDATQCQECGACVALCPQHINIPEMLKVVDAEAKLHVKQ